MSDTLEVFGVEYTGVNGFKAKDNNGNMLTFTRGGGSGSAISIVDTPDSHGGTIRTISAIDISDTTATAEDVAQGKYFYTADGTKTAGTASGGGGLDWNVVATRDYGEVSVVVDTVTVPADYAFQRTAITSLSSNSFTSLSNMICQYCTQLVSINFPNVTNTWAQNEIFRGCTQLTSVNLPKVGHLHTGAFRDCTALECIVLPVTVGYSGNGGTLNHTVFTNCTSLTKADLGSFTSIGTSSFENTALNTLILRKTSAVIALGGTNVFNNSPFASGGTGGTLYVPSALISSYQSATNWSTILGYENNNIQAIEGSQYENYYADGTQIS